MHIKPSSNNSKPPLPLKSCLASKETNKNKQHLKVTFALPPPTEEWMDPVPLKPFYIATVVSFVAIYILISLI
jgi:hypothetical protein